VCPFWRVCKKNQKSKIKFKKYSPNILDDPKESPHGKKGQNNERDVQKEKEEMFH
jgi:hypothetical protein